MAIEDLPAKYESIEETEPTIRSQALAAIAEGKPYLFLRGSVQNETLLVEMDTNIPENEIHIAESILRATLTALPGAESKASEPRSYYDDDDDVFQ